MRISELSPRALRGLARSLATYRGAAHHASLTRFLGEVAPGARLVFDIGAHVGDRVRAFRARGARVVALEPQPLCFAALRALHGRDRGVTLLRACAGAEGGEAVMRVNRANPSVSTASPAFVEATRGKPGWAGQRWDGELRVPAVTLDGLVARFGVPDFVKIDVEGAEAAVLAGLSAPVPRLSFEVTTAHRAAGLAALERAAALGFRAFRLTLGESHDWAGGWQDAAGMARTLRALPEAANSGDVVARR